MVITFLASFLIWLLVGLVVVLGVTNSTINRKTALKAVLAFGLAILVSQQLKGLFGTTRPFVLGASTPLTFTVPQDNAFPSSHTAGAIALASVVWFGHKRLGTALLVTAIIVGLARVWARVHWPIDIIGGAVVGLAIAVILEKMQLRRLFHK